MWVKQCHKPPPFWMIWNPSHKILVILGMVTVLFFVLTTLDVG
jgi:hypothetical protein